MKHRGLGCCRQEAMKMFASKLLIHEIEKFILPDGGGYGGQVAFVHAHALACTLVPARRL